MTYLYIGGKEFIFLKREFIFHITHVSAVVYVYTTALTLNSVTS